MPRFDPLAYRSPRPSPWLIHAMGVLNRRAILPGLLRVRAIDFPDEDVRRVRALVRPGAAAFLGPNHPEFTTDWLIDKEISRRVSPLMAHWASYEIVNMHPWAQALWLRNNLIANAPGGSGRADSIAWALAGHGVLLHPEGTPTWHGDHVAPLVPGIVEMAWETCVERPGLPVHVVPLVWKLRFTGDVGPALGREMAYVERRLGLASGRGLGVAERFARLQRAILARSLERYGAGAAVEGGFFEAQAAHAAALLARLEARYGETRGEFGRRAHALRRAILKAASDGAEEARPDRRVLLEVERLSRFTRELYGGATLTQEQIAESLKQVRLAFLTRGLRDGFHGVVPVAVAERIAHVRAPAPIAVHEAFARGGDAEAARVELLAGLRARLQGGIDALNAEIASAVDPWRRENLLR
jgi:hypothetical protein